MDINRNASAVAFQRYNVQSPSGAHEGQSNYGVGSSQEHLDGGNPLSSGQATFGSVAQTTAWRAGHGADKPLSYSRQTRGTTLSFDEGPTRPQIEG